MKEEEEKEEVPLCFHSFLHEGGGCAQPGTSGVHALLKGTCPATSHPAGRDWNQSRFPAQQRPLQVAMA